MPRTTGNPARNRRKKKVMERASGFHAARGRYRLSKERAMRADAFAYEGRKQRKRQFRSLWITRLNAAARQHGLRYSTLIRGLQLAGIELNRKMLSELAIFDEAAFAVLAARAKAALPEAAGASAA